MAMLRKSWEDVNVLTVNDCFQKAYISGKGLKSTVNDSDDPFKNFPTDVDYSIDELQLNFN